METLIGQIISVSEDSVSVFEQSTGRNWPNISVVSIPGFQYKPKVDDFCLFVPETEFTGYGLLFWNREETYLYDKTLKPGEVLINVSGFLKLDSLGNAIICSKFGKDILALYADKGQLYSQSKIFDFGSRKIRLRTDENSDSFEIVKIVENPQAEVNKALEQKLCSITIDKDNNVKINSKDKLKISILSEGKFEVVSDKYTFSIDSDGKFKFSNNSKVSLEITKDGDVSLTDVKEITLKCQKVNIESNELTAKKSTKYEFGDTVKSLSFSDELKDVWDYIKTHQHFYVTPAGAPAPTTANPTDTAKQVSVTAKLLGTKKLKGE